MGVVCYAGLTIHKFMILHMMDWFCWLFPSKCFTASVHYYIYYCWSLAFVKRLRAATNKQYWLPETPFNCPALFPEKPPPHRYAACRKPGSSAPGLSLHHPRQHPCSWQRALCTTLWEPRRPVRQETSPTSNGCFLNRSWSTKRSAKGGLSCEALRTHWPFLVIEDILLYRSQYADNLKQ